VERLACRIALTPDLVGTHNVFHVSMLRKYIANLNVIVEYEPLEIQEGLTYVEEPLKIVDKKEQVLHTKRFLSSKYYGAIMELRKHCGKQNTICKVATRIYLNDYV
jgi:hypothetical protein